jgi:hypothetical protein
LCEVKARRKENNIKDPMNLLSFGNLKAAFFSFFAQPINGLKDLSKEGYKE